MSKNVDIIVSCYNEEENILPFFVESIKYLTNKNYNYNVIYVNDGSTDKTYEKVIELVDALVENKKNKKNNQKIDGKISNKLIKSNLNKNKNIKVSLITFNKNYGHEAAMCAGLDYSKADYLIFMDVDLQNPPKKIPEILKKFECGADCVLLRRVKYSSASFVKKITSKGYYLFSKIILRNKNERDVSDFFAINKKLAKIVKDNYKTRLRFIRSFVQKEANNIQFVNYENEKRNAGDSRYNYLKLTKLALISELSRIKFLRDVYKITNEKKVYIIDKKKTLNQ